MCKLVIGTQEGTQPNFKKLIQAQEDDLRTQPDGFSALVIDKAGEVQVYRSLEDYDEGFEWLYNRIDESKLVAVHTRIGTSGADNLHNVHFFERDGRFFAHNGFVHKYHNPTTIGYTYHKPYKGESFDFDDYLLDDDVPSEQVEVYQEAQILSARIKECRGCKTSNKRTCKTHVRQRQELNTEIIKANLTAKGEDVPTVSCDSLKFLESLPDKLNRKVLAQEVDNKKFEGFGALIDAEAKTVHLLVYKDVKFITDSNKFGLCFSYEPELKFDLRITKKWKGIEYVIDEQTEMLEYEVRDVNEGVYKVDLRFSKGKS